MQIWQPCQQYFAKSASVFTLETWKELEKFILKIFIEVFIRTDILKIWQPGWKFYRRESQNVWLGVQSFFAKIQFYQKTVFSER